MNEYEVTQGDCREVLRTLDDNSVDAVVTDPPYHLTTGKKGGSGPASVSLDSPHGRARIGTGFMGMKWDGGDVAFRPETWAEVLRVLKPGGYLLAFGGTRTYHRLVCAIEDGGFEVRDMLAWLYGSGFPKGTDKAKIPEAWRGWNTALKPAIEPVCLGRKPMEGTLAENLQRWGTGALWIDGCRIEGVKGVPASPARKVNNGTALSGSVDGSLRNCTGDEGNFDPLIGRWPANVLHDGSDEVLAVFPQAPGQLADASSSSSSRKTQNTYGAMKRGNEAGAQISRKDSGSAARFFYCAKTSRAERGEGNTHPTVKPQALMRYLCKMITPPKGLILDPFTGSGSTGCAAVDEGFRFFGCELDPDYLKIAKSRIAAALDERLW